MMIRSRQASDHQVGWLGVELKDGGDQADYRSQERKHVKPELQVHLYLLSSA
jgi:hypothetical protein